MFLLFPLCAVLSCSVVPDSFRPHGLQPTRLLCPLGFSRAEYWNGYLFPSPGDLPNPGIIPRSPALQVDSLPAKLPGKPTIPLDASPIIQFYLLWPLHVSIILQCVYSDLACLPSSQICLPELRSLLNSQVCLLWPGVSLVHVHWTGKSLYFLSCGFWLWLFPWPGMSPIFSKCVFPDIGVSRCVFTSCVCSDLEYLLNCPCVSPLPWDVSPELFSF